MPKTKRPVRRTCKKADETANIKAEKENHISEVTAYVKEFDANCKKALNKLRLDHDMIMQKVNVMLEQFRIYIPAYLGNKTVEEIENGDYDSTSFLTFSDFTSGSINFETAKSKQTERMTRKRSLSSADDGYRTAGSDDNSRGRKSRNRAKYAKTDRSSRSSSRSKLQQKAKAPSAISTPLNKGIPKNTFGTVTPKVKPNTPQVILRRPKEGEMAISMQGSPLMVNTILSSEANVNIPLPDGRTISIQPQRGLRMSQLPALNSSVRRQIEALRDNLIKVCQIK